MRLFRVFYLTIVLYLSRLPLSSPDSCIQVQDVLDLSEYFYMLNCWGFTPTLCVGLLFGALQALLLPFYQTAFNLRNAISTYLRLSETRTFRLLSAALLPRNSREKILQEDSIPTLAICPYYGLQIAQHEGYKDVFFSLFYWIGMGGLLGVMGTIFRECTNSTIFTYVI